MAEPSSRRAAPEVQLHQEVLHVGTERVAVERVRVAKRIVTETRTIEVPVRTEELVVTREELDPVPLAEPAADADEIVVVLHEEVPEVTLRVLPVERVVVRKRTVRGEDVVSADLATEVADVTVVGPATENTSSTE
ncbi:DUF2382 domain-containing protein [Kineococcus sp. SYSU DK003]|uniref:DUF2382 domain-containing protein n=1 Tax=Kineococcus sp. SYSU DK003 TaxID=3383124 RepID=UPI003D7CEBB4